MLSCAGAWGEASLIRNYGLSKKNDQPLGLVVVKVSQPRAWRRRRSRCRRSRSCWTPSPSVPRRWWAGRPDCPSSCRARCRRCWCPFRWFRPARKWNAISKDCKEINELAVVGKNQSLNCSYYVRKVTNATSLKYSSILSEASKSRHRSWNVVFNQVD